MPEQVKSLGHVAFVGEFEFFTHPGGGLYWARVDQPLEVDGRRTGQFYTGPGEIEFALQMARLAAGEWVRVHGD
jgi:hypothetical protein